ncbi:hypothetical protein [Nocardia transvalensis]|uniref:hypothetical protein n=1 Tax=Nocardia transvalensis TaxID=37333 RepID=UPI001894CF95|nr:hypothetical protein [Nocardia transvalensis]MBF6333460.1 hypothetical protein [Nocardia transvalensis]
MTGPNGGRGDTVGFNWWREDANHEQAGTSVQEILARVRAERRRERVQAEDARAADAGLWPTGWPHEAPDRPLSVPEAQKTMQRHRDCLKENCPRKKSAWRTLVEAGKIKPDTGRNY